MDSIDTRLLSVFDEIYRRRSVSEAADAMDMGQPAVSVALAKLRHQFGDPLFVRTSGGMEPTPFAQGLAPASGPGLILQTLPLAFSQMPGGTVIGPLFFVLVETYLVKKPKPEVSVETSKKGSRHDK